MRRASCDDAIVVDVWITAALVRGAAATRGYAPGHEVMRRGALRLE
jgi:hypothetical protein